MRRRRVVERRRRRPIGTGKRWDTIIIVELLVEEIESKICDLRGGGGPVHDLHTFNRRTRRAHGSSGHYRDRGEDLIWAREGGELDL